MKKTFIYWGALVFFLLASCSDNISYDDSSSEQTIDKTGDSSKGTKRTKEEVLAIAENFFTQVQLRSGTTKSSSQRKVKSVDIVHDLNFNTNFKSLRSTSGQYNNNLLTDSLLYLVNYEDNNGFALIGADTRLDDIYAISEKGSFQFADSIEIPALSAMFEIMRYNISESLKPKANITKAAVTTSTTVIKDWTTMDYNITPRLDVQWGQGAPFNRYCFTTDGRQAVAGCVAIALAQCMLYCEYPKSYNGYTFNWNEIKKVKNRDYSSLTGADQLARLINCIGILVNMDYGVSSSEAYSERIFDAMTAMGYPSQLGFEDRFYYAPIAAYLDNGNIIYARATTDDRSGGHAWVIDGCMDQERVTYNSYDGTMYSYRYLAHCRFGWNGTADGYYSVKVGEDIDTQQGPVTGGNGSTGSYLFKWSKKVCGIKLNPWE